MRNKLVLVSDLGCLKAYKVDYDGVSTNPRVELIEEVTTEEADGRLSDKVTDEAGRFAGGERGHHVVRAYGERHNIVLELERRAIDYLAGKLNQIVKDNKNDDRSVYFAAVKEINNQIVDRLEPAVRMQIEKNVPEDLTKVQGTKLLQHF
jgi:hypothetical protein